MSDRTVPDTTACDGDEADLVPRDKLFEHHRRQLSAMLDGELPPDQAKFMLRRLQHDGELAECWERWQVCGDILRGRHDALLPADFSSRVHAAIAAGDLGGADSAAAVAATAPAAPATRSSQRWMRWGGGALAASVALVAMMFARVPNAPGVVDPAGDASPRVATVTGSDVAPDGLVLAGAAPAASTRTDALAPPPQPAGGAFERGAGLAAAAVAVAAVPRRSVDRDARSTRSQAQRAGLRLRNDDAPAIRVAAASAAPQSLEARAASPVEGVAATGPVALDPFNALPVAPSRPWPRAILPAYESGAFNARFVEGGAVSFHPFEPTAAAPSVDAAGDAADPLPTTRGPR